MQVCCILPVLLFMIPTVGKIIRTRFASSLKFEKRIRGILIEYIIGMDFSEMEEYYYE